MSANDSTADMRKLLLQLRTVLDAQAEEIGQRENARHDAERETIEAHRMNRELTIARSMESLARSFDMIAHQIAQLNNCGIRVQK